MQKTTSTGGFQLHEIGSVPEPFSLNVRDIPIGELRPDPTNPRRISDESLEALTRSITEFGLIDPAIVRKDDLTVIGGHQRITAARKAGLSSMPCVVLDIDPEKARILGIALNRISGEFDEELLAHTLAEIEEASPDLDLTLSGFDEDELRDLLRAIDAREKRDRPETFDFAEALAAASRNSRTQRGDIWILGEHRLMCGDATDAADVERLLDGTRPSMVFTDPPYNVNYGHHGNPKWRDRGTTIANDALDPVSWEKFVVGWTGSLLASVDGAIYICMSGKEWPTVCQLMEEGGGHWSTTVIWAKDRFTLGRADYQRQYEPIWYGWREGKKHHWCGDRNQGDVWSFSRPDSSDLHPTMKPLDLIEHAIENSSLKHQSVLDLFMGSGSTMIACERTGRRAIGMEIDPAYVDAAVARWEAFTGEKAHLNGDSDT